MLGVCSPFVTRARRPAPEVHPSRFSRIATTLCSPFSRYGEGRTTIKREIPYIGFMRSGCRASASPLTSFCAAYNFNASHPEREETRLHSLHSANRACVVTGARARLPLDRSRAAHRRPVVIYHITIRNDTPWCLIAERTSRSLY